MQKTKVRKKLNFKTSTEKALSVLSERNRDILSSRHGITTTGDKKTLEGIGKEYGITRERVRQIEEASYEKLRNSEEYSVLEPYAKEVKQFLDDHCGVTSEEYLMNALASEAQRPYLGLLLALDNNFVKIKESDENHVGWASDKNNAKRVLNILNNATKEVERKNKPLAPNELFEIINKLNTYLPLNKDNIEPVLSISKRIQKSPFEYWGLSDWPQINPRGVRDKVYLVLERTGKPLHFRELANYIDKAPFNNSQKEKTHPQTVHNELIKDDRFVLIGRGVYALTEWGYMHGTVKDVIMDILKNEGKPLDREEIISRVLQQRAVQKNTILLNLQNKKTFAKVDRNRYYLA